jgi:hypothetical protein
MPKKPPQYIYLLCLCDTADGASIPVLAYASFKAAEYAAAQRTPALKGIGLSLAFRVVAMELHDA